MCARRTVTLTLTVVLTGAHMTKETTTTAVVLPSKVKVVVNQTHSLP